MSKTTKVKTVHKKYEIPILHDKTLIKRNSGLKGQITKLNKKLTEEKQNNRVLRHGYDQANLDLESKRSALVSLRKQYDSSRESFSNTVNGNIKFIKEKADRIERLEKELEDRLYIQIELNKYKAAYLLLLGTIKNGDV